MAIYSNGKKVSPIIKIKDTTALNNFIRKADNIVITEKELEGLTTLKQYSFTGQHIKRLELPEGLTKININSIYNSEVKELIIPSTVSTMASSSFFNISGLEELDCSTCSASYSGSPFFANACNLKKIKLGKNMIPQSSLTYDYSSDGYAGMPFLEEIVPHPNNLDKSLAIRNNALVNLNNKYLVQATVNTEAIPQEVTTLGNGCFSGLRLKNKTFQVPSTITTFNNNAFSHSNIEDLTITTTNTNLGSSTFKNLFYLKRFTLVGTNNISNSYGIGYWLNKCPYLEELIINAQITTGGSSSSYYLSLGCNSENGLILTLGRNVTSLPTYYFRSYAATSTFNFSEGLYKPILDSDESSYEYFIEPTAYENGGRTYINYINWNDIITDIPSNAFTYCRFNTINIPNTIKTIQNSAFAYSYKVKEIYYNANITNSLSSTNSIFYFTDLDPELALTIGKDVNAIPNYLFGNSSSSSYAVQMKYIWFERNSVLTQIPNNAFYNCSNLESIMIPHSVTTIGQNAFYNCTNLKTIYYEGTKDEWEAITKNDTTSYFINAEVIYYFDHIHNGYAVDSQGEYLDD